MPRKPSPVPTVKQWAGFRRAYTAPGFTGIGANDNWNVQTYGITSAQHAALARVCADLCGMEAREAVRRGTITRARVLAFLDGAKVYLTRDGGEHAARVAAAFGGAA